MIKIVAENYIKEEYQEEFLKLNTSFNIRFIGKIYTNYKMYKGKRYGNKH